MRPKLLVADEPVSALDVSVQRQVLELFGKLRRDVRGEVVENGLTAEVFGNPQHDYTRRLLGAVPGTRLIPAIYQA